MNFKDYYQPILIKLYQDKLGLVVSVFPWKGVVGY